jgi:exodeoxyribonuclease VII small subunit
MSNRTSSEAKSFEEAFAELEKCVQRLEDGQIPLEEALRCYENGVALFNHCNELLSKARERIQLLTGEDGQGNPILKAFKEPEE